MKVTLEDIKAAREILNSVVRKTPLEQSIAASQLTNSQIYLKCENFQLTGSFKMRGAYNKIASLTDAEKKKGVIAASAGNHAQGVALSATKLGVKSTVVMPKGASIVKQTATRNYGAEVILYGDIYDEAYTQALELEKTSGAVFVHPFQDPKVIAGQGTIALEVLEDLPDLDSIVVAIGGGGLISGIAIALKELKPNIKIYGVVAANAPGMSAKFHNLNTPKDLSYLTIADGIAVKKPSQIMYDNFISQYVDDIITISEDEIAESIAFLLERSKMMVEGSGAITLAAALSGRLKLGQKSVLTLCGGNIDLNLVGEILDRGLSRSGRNSRISVVVSDRPGTLGRLTKIIGDLGGNILDVNHDRIDPELLIRETKITFLLETKDSKHAKEIASALEGPGVRLLL